MVSHRSSEGKRKRLWGWRIDREGIYKRVGENSHDTRSRSQRGIPVCRTRGIVTAPTMPGLIPPVPHHRVSTVRHIGFYCTGANHELRYLLQLTHDAPIFSTIVVDSRIINFLFRTYFVLSSWPTYYYRQVVDLLFLISCNISCCISTLIS